MELGVGLPTSGELATPENIARVAQEAERLGYAALWTYERLLRPMEEFSIFGGPPQRVPEIYQSVYEPLETLSYVAALTERIKLGTSIVDALFHVPVVLARRFATLDRLSGGRVIAGLGQGWMPHEFETANVPMSRIGAGMDEVVAAMRACWGPDPVEYEGRYYRIAPSEVNPKPVQNHVPILLGSTTPKGVRRAARIADGVNPIAFSEESLLGLVKEYHDAVTELGRDPATAPVYVRANVPITSEPLGADRPYLGGSPRQIADDLSMLDGVGVHHVLFSNMAPTGIDGEIRLLAELREAVG
ncbi:TIGR03619 family F420-dependent LLM class oxidoreductase [Allorhizocola rhizosphaerae]|uniref:TIGR03619 family F420-dependent LLM class oxidoreductase n=1 Tax=Allorhizocola rhizosphaerae TaxID=1872709 RepID=UPI000E3D54B9|nr:TIGR03619 family F420-dependent LLM class oxidoreductase [Allorhizocola rhizosphaerae]